MVGVVVPLFLWVEQNKEKNPTISRENTVLWHQRPWHIRKKGLQVLHGNGMV